MNQHGFVDATPSPYRVTGSRWRSSATACGCTTGFPLRLLDVQEMMAERGVIVSYESIHQWCRKFGSSTEIPVIAAISRSLTVLTCGNAVVSDSISS